MLFLSRKKNEVIKIGDDIELTVVEIRGDKVRLGIQAPREIPIHRDEVYEAIRAAIEDGEDSEGGENQSEAGGMDSSEKSRGQKLREKMTGTETQTVTL